ncbi:MFS transporter [Bacillus horti]|uniref:MFS family arabinose efflux permease n=1 Tax=Caldalkalibacillus horti TaxID=77523 RepID=A0ABT9W4Q2_9BACI|nr:MFS transporter [Bacillus horti]MDQ0168233.1 putative MFS family arabinose efflux permease [Bacillus horti]
MWKLVFLGVAMIAVTYALARLSFGLFLPDIAESLRLTAGEAGMIGSTAYIAYTFALLTSSFLIQRWGTKKVVQCSGLSALLGLIGIALAQDVYTMVLCSFIGGVGSGWASPALSQVASISLKDNEKDKANTWINSGTSFGLILTGPIALALSEYWRLAYLFFAVIALFVLIWSSKSIPSYKLKLHEGEAKQPIVGSLVKAKNLLLASLLAGGVSSVYWTFSRSYINVMYEMSANDSVIFWIIMGIAGIGGAMAGRVIHKIGLAYAYRLILGIMLFSISSITIPTMVTVYVSGLLFGVSFIFLTGLFIVWGTRLFPSSPAMGVSLAFLALGAGQSVGSFAAGLLIEATSYLFCFLFVPLIGLVGLLIPVNKKVCQAYTM